MIQAHSGLLRIKSLKDKYLSLSIVTVLLIFSFNCFSQAKNNNPRVFNVKLFGASGDSTQDATPFIQLAINACISAGGGTVYFPNGFYWCSGALVTSENGVNPNSQLYIPPVAFSSNSRTHISFEGETKPNFSPAGLLADVTYPRRGVIIKSTITGSGVNPSVFGGIGDAASGTTFLYHYVSFKNITLIVKANAGASGPTMSGINGQRYASLNVDNCVVGIDTSLFRSVQPTNEVAGIMCTDNAGEAFNNIRNTLVFGMKYGIIAGDHQYFENAQVYANHFGFVFPHTDHARYGSKILAQWNKVDLWVPTVAVMGYTTGVVNLKIGLLMVETWTTAVNWFNNTINIADSGFVVKGDVTTYSQNSLGVATSVTSYAASTFRITQLSNTGILPNPVSVSADKTTANAITITKPLTGNASIANTGAGTLVVQNSSSAGDLLLAGSAGAGLLITSTGAATLGSGSNSSLTVNANASTIATFKNVGSGNGAIYVNSGSNTSTTVGFQNNGTTAWYTGNKGSTGPNTYGLTNSDANGNSMRFAITQAGIVTLNAYGAGTATFDASGVISSVSDERLKDIQGFYKAGLKELMKINPIVYKWNSKSDNETVHTYAGFSAQNVKANIPYGTGENEKGYLSLQDRAIIATLVNAVKEQQQQIEVLKKEIIKLKNR